MKNVMKDVGSQSVFLSGLSAFLSWLADQHNLLVISLILAIITSLWNIHSKWEERKVRKRQEQRAEEKHSLEMEHLKKQNELHLDYLREQGEIKNRQLKRGLRDEPIKDSG